MTTPLRNLLLSAGALGLAFVPANEHGSALTAAGSSLVILADSDGDGLDDALEARWGTGAFLADSDGDGIHDADELLLGLDPLTFDDTDKMDRPDPAVRIEAYALGQDMVLQVFALCRGNATRVAMCWATEDRMKVMEAPAIRGYLTEPASTAASSVPGMQRMSFRMLVPRTWFENAAPAAVGVLAFLDGQHWGADDLRLVDVQNTVLELREDAAMSRYGGGQGGSGGGGLFPADPTDPMPGEAVSEQVCVQTLQAQGAAAGGKVIYAVSDAYCDYMPGALCFAGCSMTQGDTVVGLDIPGLLGSLNP